MDGGWARSITCAVAQHSRVSWLNLIFRMGQLAEWEWADADAGGRAGADRPTALVLFGVLFGTLLQMVDGLRATADFSRWPLRVDPVLYPGMSPSTNRRSGEGTRVGGRKRRASPCPCSLSCFSGWRRSGRSVLSSSSSSPHPPPLLHPRG